jgi:predicted acetyltransferase
MGFGFSSKIHLYSLHPAQLPNFPGVPKAALCNSDDLDKLADCYQRIYNQTHGFMTREKSDWQQMLHPGVYFAACREEERITGFAFFCFKKGKDILTNDIQIYEFVYENTTALQSLLSFFHNQNDQVNQLHLPLHDEEFSHLLSDPRLAPYELMAPLHHVTEKAGIGLMVRLVNVAAAITNRQWPAQMKGKVAFCVTDTFLPELNGTYTFQFAAGKASPMENKDADAVINIHIRELASLLMGSIGWDNLIKYGLAEANGNLELLHRLFANQVKPACINVF